MIVFHEYYHFFIIQLLKLYYLIGNKAHKFQKNKEKRGLRAKNYYIKIRTR